ncbi:MAG: carbohydrate-binding domain-containing protein [Lachnospiraceae bacterium]|nr:carbohydrate-binding domain-containing protein [Lachnospiraceae bacterium]
MSSHKNTDLICILIILLAAVITVLFINGRAFGIKAEADEDAEYYEGDGYFTSNDLNPYEAESADCVISLEGADGRIDGNGAYFYDGDLVISGGGKYLISGELTDGRIIVDAYASSKVWLILDGVNIYCADDAALRVDQADKVFITLKDGSTNSISSGEEYSDDAVADGAGGALFSHDDLTINGTGELTIDGAYKHGIDANDSLHITGGSITITSKADGLHVNDEINFRDAALTVNAGDDALHSDEAINILGGTILINECYEGLEAKIINMEDGDVTIYPSDDGFNANGNSDSGFGFGFGGMGGGMGGRPDFTMDTESGNRVFGDRPGRKGNGETAENADEAGLPDGFLSSDMSNEEEAEETEETEETYIRISGGSIVIVNSEAQDADGLDSNGDIYINGGVIRISMSGNGNNSAIDYGSESGGVLTVSGGDIIACGGSSMAEAFSDTSTQCCALIKLSETVEAGESLTVEDEKGNVILSWEVPCSFNAVNISSADLAEGNTYTLKAGEAEETVTFDSISVSEGESSGMGGFGGHRPGGFNGADSDEGMPQGFPDDFFGDVSGNMFPGNVSGNMFPGGGKPQDFPDGGFDDEVPEDTEASADSGVLVTELGLEAYLWLAASLTALIIGLIFAVSYRRHH